jgi:hypothetical protein
VVGGSEDGAPTREPARDPPGRDGRYRNATVDAAAATDAADDSGGST